MLAQIVLALFGMPIHQAIAECGDALHPDIRTSAIQRLLAARITTTSRLVSTAIFGPALSRALPVAYASTFSQSLLKQGGET